MCLLACIIIIVLMVVVACTTTVNRCDRETDPSVRDVWGCPT